MTPPDIVPEWYLLPFYAMLRSIPNKLLGVIVMFGAIASLVFIPWLDTSRVRSCRFRPLMKQFFWAFLVACVLLGYCGGQSVDAARFGIPLVWVARIASIYYYVFFWLIMPIVGLIETPKKLPASIAQSVLGDYRRGTRRVRTTMRLTTVTLGTAWVWPSAFWLPPRPSRWTPHASRPRRRPSPSKVPSAPMIAAPCSAAIRSTRKSARPVIRPSTWRSTTWRKPGGPEFSEAQARALAAAAKVPAEPNDKGETTDDKGVPLTALGDPGRPLPVALSQRECRPRQQWRRAAARSQHDRQGARRRAAICLFDPDRLRQPAPAGFKVTDGKYYNPYFEGWNISMPPPLKDGTVTYSDGTKATRGPGSP